MLTARARARLNPRSEQNAVVNSGEHGFEYHPVLADAPAFLDRAGASRFLLVGRPLGDGDGLPVGFERVPECRHLVPAADPVLPRGNYLLATPGRRLAPAAPRTEPRNAARRHR